MVGIARRGADAGRQSTTGKGSGMEGSTALIAGGEGDSVVLAEVLAFLDGFDDNASAETSASTGPLTTRAGASSPGRRRPPGKSRPRVGVYWRRKRELQALRTTAEYLSNVLEWMKSGSCQLLRLGATASHTGAVGWEQRAQQERVLLEQAWRTNASLRRLLQSQKRHARTSRSMLDCLSTCAWEMQQCIASGGPLGYLERSTVAHTPGAWTTSHSVPLGDPSHIGARWWHAVQQLSLLPKCGLDSLSLERQKAARFEVPSLWVVQDKVYKEMSFHGVVMIDVDVSDTHWTLTKTANVHAGPERKLLFRVTSVRTVTAVSRSSSPPTCTFQATHQAHALTASDPPVLSEADELEQTKDEYFREVGVSAWASVMREADGRMRLLFEELDQARG